MHAKMDVIRGAKTKEIRLKLPSVIGRGKDSKIKLPASTVSRHHCELYEYEGQIVVRDLGSSNGTVVNGHRIKGPTFLTPDDELSIGPLTARVSIAEEPDAIPQLEPSQQEEPTPVDDQAPSLEELPVESKVPTVALKQEEVKVFEAEAIDEYADDDSVLEYSEPSSVRSFVSISPVENDSDGIVPNIDAIGGEAEPQVAPDDSALNDFFKKLDDS